MMNCKQVQELLPLSVGLDLEESRQRTVVAHVQSCFTCFDAAKELQEMRRLLREYESPEISQEVYASIRREVLHEIEAESTGTSLRTFIATIFQSRLTWALASALIIASMVAVYFISDRQKVEPAWVNNNPIGVLPGPTDDDSMRPAKPNLRVKESRWIEPRRSQRRKSRSLIIHGSSEMAGLLPQHNVASPNLFPLPQSAASEKVVRMEIQTKDPNIRIIWFSQSKPGLAGTKGT